MEKLSPKELAYKYLEAHYPDFVSPSKLGRSVFGEGYYSATASPICKKLVDEGKAVRNNKGHYQAVVEATASS